MRRWLRIAGLLLVLLVGARSTSAQLVPPAATPGGADTNVQYNDGGTFGGDANFTWDKTLHRLVLTSGSVFADSLIADEGAGSVFGYHLQVGNGGEIGFSNGAAYSAYLKLVSADILSQQNGTTAQEFRIYGTTTGPKYLSLTHDGTNALVGITGGGTLSVNKVAITAPATSATLTIADGKTWTVTNTASLGTLTDGKLCQYTAAGTSIDCTATASGSGTVTQVDTTSPITGGPITTTGTIACPTCGVTGTGLNQFGSTTSAQLAGVISDETGTDKLVYNTSPALVTPTLGVASATSINKVAITAPASSATLTIADGKTWTVTNTASLGTLTDGKLCAYTAAGTSIDCTTTASGSGTVTNTGTITDHALIVGNGGVDVSALAAATNGQIPIGSTGADPVIALPTGAGNVSIAGGAGTLTITGNVDVQAFTAGAAGSCPGDATTCWTKPTSFTPKAVFVFGCGSGGGGGGGSGAAAGAARTGGGGGGGGYCSGMTFRASDLAATVAVTTGVGGALGTGGSSGSGADGGGGNSSSFGGYATWYGGGGGAGNNTGGAGGSGAGCTAAGVSNTNAVGVAGGACFTAGIVAGNTDAGMDGRGAPSRSCTTSGAVGNMAAGGGASGAAAASAGAVSTLAGGSSFVSGSGGGAGGGVNAANPGTAQAGTDGGASAWGKLTSGGGGTGGTAAACASGGDGVAGAAGSAAAGGAGGGGGASINNATGCVGGDGGAGGGGGGGGGAGTSTGGAGGTGGVGLVIVISW